MTDGFALKSWVISLVNKVTKKSNKYSTDETVVGTWIDGKPIYRKVIKDINTSIPTKGWTLITNIDDIELVINSILFYGDENNTSFFANGTGNFSVEVNTSNNGILLWNRVGSVTYIKAAVIEYTKTTDEAVTS